MRGVLKSRRGEALIIVICVMAVMMTLSLTLLSSAGLLVANSQRGLRQEQMRIAATTLDTCVREELNMKDALSEEATTLLKYLKDNIEPLTTRGWDHYPSSEAAEDDKYSKMDVSTLEAAKLPAEFSDAIEKAEIGIYYIADDAELARDNFVWQCDTVKLVVATTVYGVDGEEYTVKSSYDLCGQIVPSDEGSIRKANWRLREKMP